MLLPIGKETRVYRFKGFDSAQCGDSIAALEAIVNAWMEQERPRIRHMGQSVRGTHIVLSFVYEDAHELEQRASVKSTATLPRFFDDDYVDERPTGARIPATPPPSH